MTGPGGPPAWWLEVKAPPGTDPACVAKVRMVVEAGNGGHPVGDPHVARVLAEAAAAPWDMAAEAALSTRTMVMEVRLSRRLPASAGRALGIRRR